eukprot:TRINITY_DN90038_c0_g1_i1.p1 TRINITY_DN90038_c0_g1~~TRINITY_DN90038_c0_g1_i1.p1  ORF type:complete len:247 (+),score=50.63 TRINITY_DN90038_c0_g1_i1:114-854(+)
MLAAAARGFVMPPPGLDSVHEGRSLDLAAESRRHARKIQRSYIDALSRSLPKVSEQRALELMEKALADLCNSLPADEAAKASQILNCVISGNASKRDLTWIRKRLEGGVAESICKIKALQQHTVDDSESSPVSLWSTPSVTPSATLAELPALEGGMHQSLNQRQYMSQNSVEQFHKMRAFDYDLWPSSLWSTPSVTPTATLAELPVLEGGPHQCINQREYMRQSLVKQFHETQALQEFHQQVYNRL